MPTIDKAISVALPEILELDEEAGKFEDHRRTNGCGYRAPDDDRPGGCLIETRG